MFSQLMRNQHKAKRKQDERSNCRRNYSYDPQSQSEGVYSSHHNNDYNQPPSRYHQRPINNKFPKEPKLDLPSFHGRESWWIFRLGDEGWANNWVPSDWPWEKSVPTH